jgi:hypothetical protein
VLSGISPPFGGLFLTGGQITHALLTRAPLYLSAEADFLVRLACVRHAASVSSEPGSNSPVFILDDFDQIKKIKQLKADPEKHPSLYSIVKDR